MAFDAQRFEQAQFRPRTEKIKVPDLAPFFDDGEPPEWEVRGLTAAELHRALEAATRQQQGLIDAIVVAIKGAGNATEAVRQALGLTKDTPAEIAKRVEMLTAGSVAPQITLAQAVKLGEVFPVEFLTLTGKISELTGRGAELVKPEAASPQTTVCEDQCTSSTTEAAISTSTDQMSSLKDG